MTETIKRMNEFYSIKELNKEKLDYILTYEKDGQFVLVTKEELKEMPMDARFDALWNSTYHALKLLLSYYNNGHEEVYDVYKSCLNKCINKKFTCEGYLSEIASMDLLKELIELGLLETIPLNSEEAKHLDNIIDSFRTINDSYPSVDSLKELLKAYDKNVIFTYGTLMKNNSNHHYLKDDEYIGDGKLNNYGLLELGYFPGAVPKESYSIIGELYKVSNEEKMNIDYLEGNLYSYKKEFIRANNKLYYAGYYEYKIKRRIDDKELCIPYGKWSTKKLNKEDFVWYVCYGSNLSYRRFLKYINSCTDKSEPIDKENITLPYNIYFAGESKNWGGAKAFLDTNGNGKSYCVKYLIKKEQYEEVKSKEGPDYKTKVDLGFDKYGIYQVSFTATRDDFKRGYPSQLYKDEIKLGLSENYGLTQEETDNYLNQILKIQWQLILTVSHW